MDLLISFFKKSGGNSMKRIMWLLIFVATLAASSAYGDAVAGDDADGDKPLVLMETSMGSIKIKLDPQISPLTVKNFLDYVNSGFYNGTIFHRVVKNFVIQGGGYTLELQPKSTSAPIRNEADNGLKNRRGTIAMARPIEVDTATSQFFFNVSDNNLLNHKDNSIQGYGYAVFGRVIEGMKVVDAIAAAATGKQKGMRNVPKTPVIIKSIRVVR
jgi:peptidyl-prolyl cis-trans isomerase A (cyclophilin A)